MQKISVLSLSIFAVLGTRSSVERSSLTAPRYVGELQLASVVACVVGAVSSEIIFVLNGRPVASDIARDSFNDVMCADFVATYFFRGVVRKAMAFLVVLCLQQV